jgi:hypothetical protein
MEKQNPDSELFMRWTYQIDGVQVFPGNPRENRIKETLENGLIWDYRKAFNGTIYLQDADYDYLKTLEETGKHSKHSLQIFDNSTLHHTCEFTIYNCEFDSHARVCTIKVTDRDTYTEIQELENIEVNVLENTETFKVSIDKYSYYVFKLYFYSDETQGLPSGSDLTSKRIRILESKYLGKRTTEIPDIGTIITHNYNFVAYTERMEMTPEQYTSANLTGWTKIVELDDYNIYERYPITDLSFQLWLGLIVWGNSDNYPLYKNYVQAYDKVHFTSVYDFNTGEEIISTYPSDYTSLAYFLYISPVAYNGRAWVVHTPLYNSRKLEDVLNEILSVIAPGLAGVKSSMLEGKYLIEVSDFKKPSARQPAERGILTFKKAIDYLCQKFNAKWYIDSDNYLCIERPLKPSLSKDISVDPLLSDKYSYLSEDKPNREFFTESLAYNEDFAQIEILYGTVPAVNGTKESTKSISLSDFYTDIDGFNSHFGEIPKEGFFLVDVLNGAVVKGTGFKSEIPNLQNVTLSNANILNQYFRHDAYQPTFHIGGKQVEAISLKWLKKQELNHFLSPDKTKLLTTKIGQGLVMSFEYNLVEEDLFKSEVIYG